MRKFILFVFGLLCLFVGYDRPRSKLFVALCLIRLFAELLWPDE